MTARLFKKNGVVLNDTIYGAWCRGQFLSAIHRTPEIGEVMYVSLRHYRVVSIKGFRIEMEPSSRRETNEKS